jgi:hypothetical protein
VPRTGDLDALNVAFRRRSTTVRTGVADGIVSSLHVEEGYFLASDCERSRLAGRHVLGLSYVEEFAIMLESVWWLLIELESLGPARRCSSEQGIVASIAALLKKAAFHIDHVVPAIVGGNTSFETLALTCVSCSLRKCIPRHITRRITAQAGLFSARRSRNQIGKYLRHRQKVSRSPEAERSRSRR